MKLELQIKMNPSLYLRDPEQSELGKNIIKHSIQLIHDNGFEAFTFKKLAESIGTTEAGVYRYFENKHKLLVYLSSWYWSWMEYRLVFATNNIFDSFDKLKKAITVVTENIEDDFKTEHINESILNKIIITEFTKTLHNKEVDNENKEGFFIIYKRVINRMVIMIKEVNPNYIFAKSLASNIVEGALHQHFLKIPNLIVSKPLIDIDNQIQRIVVLLITFGILNI
jgi:AcrR family transcriptional regulator